jgi:hypothetical protein
MGMLNATPQHRARRRYAGLAFTRRSSRLFVLRIDRRLEDTSPFSRRRRSPAIAPSRATDASCNAQRFMGARSSSLRMSPLLPWISRKFSNTPALKSPARTRFGTRGLWRFRLGRFEWHSPCHGADRGGWARVVMAWQWGVKNAKHPEGVVTAALVWELRSGHRKTAPARGWLGRKTSIRLLLLRGSSLEGDTAVPK